MTDERPDILTTPWIKLSSEEAVENGRARVDRPVRLENVQAELSRLRLELSAWREELMALLSDGLAQGAVNWPAVRETRRHLEETVAAMRRLQAGPDSASQSD